MSRYLEFKTANEEIEALERWQNQPSGPNDDRVLNGLLAPLVASRISALKALFDEPAPPPVEPVKPKAKHADVSGAVLDYMLTWETDTVADETVWPEWAKERGLNIKSVMNAVRRVTSDGSLATYRHVYREIGQCSSIEDYDWERFAHKQGHPEKQVMAAVRRYALVKKANT